jgi:hypothetical protein
MKLLEWFLKANASQLQQAALAYERSKRVDAALSADDARRLALKELDGPNAVLMGYVAATGEPLRVGVDSDNRHEYIGGTTGGGKTYSILNRLEQRFEAAAHGRYAMEAELIDPKTETFREMKYRVARIWLDADDETREWMQGNIYVIDSAGDKLTPTAPLDNRDGLLSDAYAAELHTRITLQASDQSYTESLRQILFMFSWLRIDLRYPKNFAFALKFFRNERYRNHVLTRVRSHDVRQYFAALKEIAAQQSIDAFLRREFAEQSFPDYRLAVGVPPANLAHLGLARDPLWTFANFGTTNTQPAALGHARFRWHVLKRLLAAARRRRKTPLSFWFEELTLLLSGSPDLVEVLMTALRTLRSAGVSLKLIAQSVTATLPHSVVENILLNTQAWSLFQARPDESELLFPHVLRSPGDQRTDAERKRSFLAEMQSLKRQHFYYLAKGHPAMLCRTPTLEHPTVTTGRSEDELESIFDAEIGARSMISSDLATHLIADWEREVVGEVQIAENQAPHVAPEGAPGNLDQLRKILGGGQ